jgi:molecular chaperone DnaK (HSP70)
VERIVGIDLGTTNSLVAYLDDATPRVIADSATGRVIVPSVVSFPANGGGGEPVVGDEARALAPRAPATPNQ